MKDQLLNLLKSTTSYVLACLLGSGAFLMGCEITLDDVVPQETGTAANVTAAHKHDKADLPHKEFAKLRATK